MFIFNRTIVFLKGMKSAPIKKCSTGYNCGGTCIEKADQCNRKIINSSNANKLDALRIKSGGGFSAEQKLARDEIISRASKLFESNEAESLFKSTAKSFKSKDNVKLTGDIRHQLKIGDESYDNILDSVRAKSGLDSYNWNKVYSSSKNAIEGLLVKGLLAAKEAECSTD